MPQKKGEAVDYRLRVPKEMDKRLKVMSEAYGISKQSVVLMIVGQHLEVTQMALEEMTKGIVEVMKEEKIND